jgi:hypothetical protein
MEIVQQRQPPLKLSENVAEKPRRESMRVNSLPHISDQDQTPVNRYNNMELRRFNPTFLSSAMHVNNKLPMFML